MMFKFRFHCPVHEVLAVRQVSGVSAMNVDQSRNAIQVELPDGTDPGEFAARVARETKGKVYLYLAEKDEE